MSLLRSLLLLASLLVSIKAYRLGESIDTDIRLDGSAQLSDAMRAQTPTFGIPTDASFDIPPKHRMFSLTFEDGLWHVPSVPLENDAKALSEWTIEFVYSRSSGTINAVSYADAKYDKDLDADSRIVVHYRWIVEADMRITAGHVVMFAIALVAGVVVLLASCSEEGGESIMAAAGNGVSVPKFD